MGPSHGVGAPSRPNIPSIFRFCIESVPQADGDAKGTPLTCGDNRRRVWDPHEVYPSLWEEHPTQDAPPVSSPIDFLFASCGESALPSASQTEVPIPRIQALNAAPSERTPIVSSTFDWAPGDFPLEVATYMQCEDSFAEKTAAPKAWLPPRLDAVGTPQKSL